MSRIQLQVSSIELKDSALEKLDPDYQFRLNLTQRPIHIREDIFVESKDQLANLNHIWNLSDPGNKLYGATLTLRSVIRKLVFECQNSKCYLHDDYDEAEHSLIGYCTVMFKNLIKNEPNIITVELLTRGVVEVVGYVKLQITICPISETFDYSKFREKSNMKAQEKQKKSLLKPKKQKESRKHWRNSILLPETNRLLE